ncbi:two-component regulator propeller domain-containing protein [candidate division KSB1 bacterium]
MYRIYLNVIFLLLLSECLFAQQPVARFDHITTEQNLSQNTVRCIYQDSRGFLWFGTQDGLNKYDGYTIKHYFHDPDNPNSLANNFIQSICEDNSGDLWIGTENGLSKLNRESGRFTNYVTDPEDSKTISDNIIYVVHKDINGDMWIGTRDGLNRLEENYDEATNISEISFIRYKHDPDDPNSLSSSQISTISSSSSNKNILWIGTARGGLNKFDIDSGFFKHYVNDPNDPNSISSDFLSSVYEDPSGTLWVGTNNGLNISVMDVNETSGDDRIKFVSYSHNPDDYSSITEGRVYSICEDDEGVLWIGTYGGLNRVLKTGEGNSNSQDLKFIRYKNEPENPYSLSDDRINTVYEDRSGVLWIGTFMRGINKLSSRNEKFKKYVIHSNDPNSLQNTIVRTFFEDDSGILWVGTQGGLNKFDRENNEHTHYNLKSDFNIENYVYSICEEKAGGLWLGCNQGGGIIKFNKRNEKYIRYLNNPDNQISSAYNSVTTIYKDRISNLWIGTSLGIVRLIPGSSLNSPPEFEYYSIYDDQSHPARNNAITVIYEDRTDGFWIGTWTGGLNKFDRESGSIKHYLNDPGDPNSLSNNRVNGIYEDSSGRFWVSTYGGGLNKFDRENEIFMQYTVKDGLPNNVVYGVLEDDNGNLWFGTNQGLCRFDPEEETFVNYTWRDGLQSNEFNWGAHFKSKSGEMFFGGIEGFNAFYPEDIKDNPHLPQIVMTDFQIFNVSVPVGKIENGKTILDKNITETKKIELSYKDNVFSFEFAALHYVEPEQNQYAYIMEGLEEEWNEVGARRYATYTHISPGEYIFKVRGSNSDGVWNEEEVSIDVIINPPFWLTTWFKVSSVFLLLVLAYSSFRLKVNSLERHRKKLEKLVSERTFELTNTNTLLEQEFKERERIDKELRKQNEFLNTTIESLAHPFYIVDINDYSIKMANTASGFDVLSGNTTCYEISHNSEKPCRDHCPIEEIKRTKESITLEHIHFDKEGNKRYEEINAHPIFNSKGEIDQVILYCIDISDRRKAEEALKNAHDKLEIRVKERTSELSISNKELEKEILHRKEIEKERLNAVEIAAKASQLASIGVMAGGITHEINQPLTAIKFNVDGVLYWDKRNKGILPEMVVSKFQDISQGIKRIDDIVKHMRSFWITPSKAEDNIFDLNEAIKGALSLIDRQLHSHGIKPELKLSSSRLSLNGTRVHVEQIVINLVLNAMRILDETQKEEKKIEISTSLENNIIILKVKDNGAGIPEENVDRLFDPFYSTSKPGKGMGLGLAIVKRFIEEHDAEISVNNNNEGGATFSIKFKKAR